MRQIDVKKTASKRMRALPPKHQRQVSQKIVSLALEPFQSDTKQLEGYTGIRRADIGEYRIIYTVTDVSLTIFIVGKRNDSDVYKRLNRLFKRG